MKWLHLSDLHYNPQGDGRSTHQLRGKLIHYLEEEHITADHLFLTGDYRHAKYQNDDDNDCMEGVTDFILRIAHTVGVPKENIHIIPGNHDLTRTVETDKVIQIKKDYDFDNGRISQSDLEFLLNRFTFFKNLNCTLKKHNISCVWPDTLLPLHTYRCYDDFSILYLNTCLTCNSDTDRGELIIGNYSLYAALEGIKQDNPGKPIIALAHHGLDNLQNKEKMAVEQLFRDYPVILYLCGDAHQPWQRRSNDFLELTMGCLVQEKNIRIVFSVGELQGNNYSIEAHEWDTSTGSWGEYSHFNRRFRKWNLHSPARAQLVLTDPCINLSKKLNAGTSISPDISSNVQGKLRNILLVNADDHKADDIFDRLVHDVFHALGFSEPYYDMDKPEGEIDMVLQHRTEKRFALVKCAAQRDAIDKSVLNAFVGTFEVEKNQYDQEGDSIVGYFVSQSGFTPAALAQEENRERGRKARKEKYELVLLGPKEIVQELIQGNVLCSLESAIGAVKYQGDPLFLCEDVDLLACEYGWIWVLYYAPDPGQAATHFALVHADGKQLLDSIAKPLLKQVSGKEYPFFNLIYMESLPVATPDEQAAQNAYFEYLQNELGEIQFEGMPTDQEAGAIKVNLENIFIPLEFHYGEKILEDGEASFIERDTHIDGVLSRTSRAAILAKPGGGKSTLMRRIALAYAYPERRRKVADQLPDENWFPIYIRCRDLGDDATKSILEIMEKIVYRAEIIQYKDSFFTLIENALQNGSLLLLIDGLDEISQEKSRVCFVNQMRTFVATYPTIHLIITSREAGFRAVAGTLASYCEHYSIANLNKNQIRQLSLKWHQALLGESSQAEEESKKVCDIILNDARIIALAENPLLLTTLLFVKRWVGYLPTKKCRLYEEMIKLLLVTWNAAGHDKLDMDETEPQLAFVAYSMTVRGLQKVTKDSLMQYIINARKAMPELLGYTKLSPSQFIDQVEERSSLLIQMGLEENDNGVLVPSYEFSHLSFQEYLTAKAVAQSWLSDTDSQGLLEILKPHIEEDHWREVIPLAAVLSGRAAKPLIEHLISSNQKLEPNKFLNFDKDDGKSEPKETQVPLHLANCIASEVPMNQGQLESAIMLTVKNSEIIKRMVNKIKFGFNSQLGLDIFTTILKSKYGSNYREIVERGLFISLEKEHIYSFSDAWLKIYSTENEPPTTPETIVPLLTKENYQDQATGALLMMKFAFNASKREKKGTIKYNDIFSAIWQLLQSDDSVLIFSSAWCIAWAGYNESDMIPHEIVPNILKRLVDLWLHTEDFHALKRTISWSIYSICFPGLKIQTTKALEEAIECHFYNPKNDFDRCAAIHLAVLTDHWTNEKISELLNPVEYPSRMSHDFSRFLQESGIKKVRKQNAAMKRARAT